MDMDVSAEITCNVTIQHWTLHIQNPAQFTDKAVSSGVVYRAGDPKGKKDLVPDGQVSFLLGPLYNLSQIQVGVSDLSSSTVHEVKCTMENGRRGLLCFRALDRLLAKVMNNSIPVV